MPAPAINLAEKLALITQAWSPRVVAELNDYQLKLVKLQGEFVWHRHMDTDELFMVVDGKLQLRLRDGTVHLDPGELYVVPRGVEHQPFAENECQVLLIEPRGVRNTGDADAPDRVAENDRWI